MTKHTQIPACILRRQIDVDQALQCRPDIELLIGRFVFVTNTMVAREQRAMEAASCRCSQKNADNSDIESDEVRYL